MSSAAAVLWALPTPDVAVLAAQSPASPAKLRIHVERGMSPRRRASSPPARPACCACRPADLFALLQAGEADEALDLQV